jgi:hypothetical protein
MRKRQVTVALVLAALASCERHSEQPAAEPFAGTTASVDKPRQGPVPGPELTAVRAERHPGFVRAVFQFDRGPLPGYRAGFLPRAARECGSGRPTSVSGQAWLELRMSPARAHGEHGRSPSFPTELRPRLEPLLELRQTCDFEGVVSWVLGLRQRVPYRVRELDHPARLVLDVASR